MSDPYAYPTTPPPESGEAYVGARYAPLVRSWNDLHVVYAHDSLAVNVDQLFV